MGIAVIFPGQGAQGAGLGRPWVDHPAWSVVERAEKATAEPLAPLLLDAPAERLTSTREAQLVVFLASLLAFEASEDALRHAGIVAFAGHSLGQVTALVAAGAVAFDDGCRLAVRRASATQAAAERRPGRLAALLGADHDQAAEACAAAGDCWVANDNAPGQIVVGGTPDAVDRAGEKAREMRLKVMPLNVGGAFHTPLMQPAADELLAQLQAIPFADTPVPVLSNVDGEPYTDAAGWPERLAAQLVRPVRWTDTMHRLVALGAEAFVEVGPGSTLTGLAKRTTPHVGRSTVATPSDLPWEPPNA